MSDFTEVALYRDKPVEQIIAKLADHWKYWKEHKSRLKIETMPLSRGEEISLNAVSKARQAHDFMRGGFFKGLKDEHFCVALCYVSSEVSNRSNADKEAMAALSVQCLERLAAE